MLLGLTWLLLVSHDAVARPAGDQTGRPTHFHATNTTCELCQKLQTTTKPTGARMMERTAAGVRFVNDFSRQSSDKVAQAHDPHFQAFRRQRNNQLAKAYNDGNLLP